MLFLSGGPASLSMEVGSREEVRSFWGGLASLATEQLNTEPTAP
jgi:hypothetical protein